jgi:DNA repair protein RadC
VKELPEGDRPREKLERVGASALGDCELLALVLGRGRAGRDVAGLASDVLAAAGGLSALGRAGCSELRAVPGIGPARAAQVVAALELGRRTLVGDRSARPRFTSPRDIALYLLPQFGARPVEQFGVVLLDTRRRLLRTAILSIGTIDASVVQPRDVYREAAVSAASAVVVFHNHPSGDPTPSRDDLLITARLVEAGRIMGIELLDHLILGDGQYASLKELGGL